MTALPSPTPQAATGVRRATQDCWPNRSKGGAFRALIGVNNRAVCGWRANTQLWDRVSLCPSKSAVHDVMPSPEGVQMFEPTNMLPELRFMISNAPLMPTEHDAASPIDCTNIVIGLS